MKKQYCTNECDYVDYYSKQAGNGISVYRGTAGYQRGYGFWGDNFKRFGIPVLKYLGKHAFNTGRIVATDVFANNENIKTAMKKRLREAGLAAGKDIIEKAATRVNQSGTGKRKRKPVSRKRLAAAKRRKLIYTDVLS